MSFHLQTKEWYIFGHLAVLFKRYRVAPRYRFTQWYNPWRDIFEQCISFLISRPFSFFFISPLALISCSFVRLEGARSPPLPSFATSIAVRFFRASFTKHGYDFIARWPIYRSWDITDIMHLCINGIFIFNWVYKREMNYLLLVLISEYNQTSRLLNHHIKWPRGATRFS